MDKDELKKLVLKKLIELQELSGHDASEITLSTKPFKDIVEFDSLRALECLTEIASSINNVFDPSLVLCFFVENGEHLSIDEFTDKLYEKLNRVGV